MGTLAAEEEEDDDIPSLMVGQRPVPPLGIGRRERLGRYGDQVSGPRVVRSIRSIVVSSVVVFAVS